MADSYQDTDLHGRKDHVPYDKRKLSYANTFPNFWKATTIRALEWATGKITLLRRIRKFERAGLVEGNPFWARALQAMGVDLLTPDEQIQRIPKTGPLVVVANHPHGLVDGVILAEMVGRNRTDYKILTRSLLTGVKEVSQFLIPVPFPHEANAQKKSVEMRKRCMDTLAEGGVIILFPAGTVMASETMCGDPVEAEWSMFTAKMVQKSGAVVVPVYFYGSNSRLYQIANQISPTLRQGLLLHEMVHSLDKAQCPTVGHPILRPEIESWESNPRGFMAWMRHHTLSLKDSEPQDRSDDLDDAQT